MASLQDAPTTTNDMMPPMLPSEEELIATFISCGVGLALYVLGLWMLYILMRAMSAVPEGHRKMAPGLVWLSAIPCFNLVWAFFLAIWIPASLKAACDARGWQGISTGRGIGLTYAVVQVLTAVGTFGISLGASFMQMQAVRDQEVISPASGMIVQIVGLAASLLVFGLFVGFTLKVRKVGAMLESDSNGAHAHGDQIKW